MRMPHARETYQLADTSQYSDRGNAKFQATKRDCRGEKRVEKKRSANLRERILMLTQYVARAKGVRVSLAKHLFEFAKVGVMDVQFRVVPDLITARQSPEEVVCFLAGLKNGMRANTEALIEFANGLNHFATQESIEGDSAIPDAYAV